MTLSIGVIGGGPSAAATILGLAEEQNLRITLITAELKLDAEDVNSHSKKSKKSFRSKRKYVNFDQDKNFIMSNNQSRQIPSNLKNGGWSSIWGGTLDKWPDEAEIHKGLVAGNLKNEYEILKRHIPYLGVQSAQYRSDLVEDFINEHYARRHKLKSPIGNFTLQPSKLGIWNGSDHVNGCVFCAKCLSGCQVGAIYSADQTIFQLQETLKKRLTVKYGYADKILECDDKIRIILSTGEKMDFDYVFIASGTISSAGILQRSNLVDDICIIETPMFLIPYIHLGRKTSLKPSKISLSEAFVKITDKSKDNLMGSGQIYSFTKNLRESTFGGIALALTRIIPPFILNRIIILMFFTKPTNEAAIVVKKKNQRSEVIFPRKYKKNNYQDMTDQLDCNFKQLGFYSLFHLKILEKPGLSYHFAGSADRVSNTPITNSDGTLTTSISGRILMSDASSMTNIEPGPITLTIMANSLRIARQFVESKR